MKRHDTRPMSNPSQAPPCPPFLGEEERELLIKRRFSEAERTRLAHLLDPFEQALKENVLDEEASSSPRYVEWSCQVARHFLARMMVDLGCTYWAFEWDRLLAWREGVLAQETGRSRYWHQSWAKHWRWVTQSLFFLGAIPYHEAMCPCSNRRLAQRWLGKEKALDFEQAFLATAKLIGYWDERTLKKTVIGALFGSLLFTGKRSPATLTRQDLEAWQSRTDRSPNVARRSVTCIQKVLAAMGSLAEEPPRRSGKHKRHLFNWGKTTPRIVGTFERFLKDMSTVREPSTVLQYRVALRKFGDWLGKQFPEISSLSELRREHVEAFKAAVTRMRCGEYTVSGQEGAPPTMRFGEPLSRRTQETILRNVRAFFSHIEALEYPERPGRPLWIAGDMIRVDEEMPRSIPEDDWRKLTDFA